MYKTTFNGANDSSFGTVFNEGPGNGSRETDDRDTLGLQWLGLQDAEKDQSIPKESRKVLTLSVPKLKGNERPRPLVLVDLPIDVLKEIIQKVTHTNDLMSLSSTCRCLHSLIIPQIYSRFDIVWPDAATIGYRVGVDALTHGLATLTNVTKRGNNYARWVKKFSLGNGPTEWVAEYNINREGGKMLCTLVNLALARMKSLETFSWDMSSGILRDVFMSLHDLNGTLKNLHVRFHDNRVPTPFASNDPSRMVESPTFKGFKGLRSLSVLDIDEKQYLEEISYAIEQSVDTLKELKLGIALHFSTSWENPEEEYTHNGEVPETIVGGVMSMLFSKIIDLGEEKRRRKINQPQEIVAAVETAEAVVMTSAAPAAVYHYTPVNSTTAVGDNGDTSTPISLAVEASTDFTPNLDLPIAQNLKVEKPNTVQLYGTLAERKTAKQLKLETLALERVPISVPIFVNSKAIDWTCLSNLTIINCPNHEILWKTLRRKFSSEMLNSSFQGLRTKGMHPPSVWIHDYKIRLKKLHTDSVTTNLIGFIRDALPPNSLEILILQDCNDQSTVTIDNIFRGAIKRHRGSLKKLLVSAHSFDHTTSFHKWIFKKEYLSFLGSGKIPNLRELGMAIGYYDWHYFLTNLPYMQHLRSLYITQIRDAPLALATRELPRQILNTVILRPEIQLCYLGIATKYFEILEGPRGDSDRSETEIYLSSTFPPSVVGPESDDDDSEAEEEEYADVADDDGAESSDSDGGYNERESFVLREILFYDDKVEIFRAMTARL